MLLKPQQSEQKRNIILVCPTEALAQSAYWHHTNWLQKDKNSGTPYKCVYHGIAHGEYPVSVNDLVYYVNEKGELKGSKGVSVMNQYYFLGFMARELLEARMIKVDKGHKEYQRVLKGKKWAKEKMIPPDSIIVFDEAHFNRSDYQQLFRETTFLEGKYKKKVMLMSATFKGKEFSITTSYPIESREIVFDKENKKLEKDKKAMDAELAKSQSVIFLKTTDLTPEQQELLKKVAYVKCDETNAEVAEEISYGVPPGGALILDDTFRMGASFKCQIVIDGAREQTVSYKGGWVKETIDKNYSEANMNQGKGRGGRMEPAKYWTLTTKTEEAGTKPNLLSAIVKAVFGDTLQLQKTYFRKEDPQRLAEVIKAAFAFPDNFGKSPEAIMVGVVPNITVTNNFPGWLAPNKKLASADEILWKQYLGTYTPPRITVKQAEQTLFLMIQTYLKKEEDLTKEIRIGLTNPLIKWANFKLDKDDRTGENQARVQKVINKVADEMLHALPDYKKGQIEYKNETTFKKVVGILKMVDQVKVKVVEIYEDEKKKILKENWMLKITYKPQP